MEYHNLEKAQVEIGNMGCYESSGLITCIESNYFSRDAAKFFT